MRSAALEIDGSGGGGEYAGFEWSTPCAMYEIPDGAQWVNRAVGPRGFTVVISEPGDRLRAMVGDGVDHQVKITVDGCSLSVPVRFWQEWTDNDGVRRMFGCLTVRPGIDPEWINESGDAQLERK